MSKYIEIKECDCDICPRFLNCDIALDYDVEIPQPFPPECPLPDLNRCKHAEAMIDCDQWLSDQDKYEKQNAELEKLRAENVKLENENKIMHDALTKIIGLDICDATKYIQKADALCIDALFAVDELRQNTLEQSK